MPEKKSWWVPMRWTHSGGAYVEAATADEAEAKANKGEFTNGVELHEAGAELVDWEVTGKPKTND